VKVTVKLLDRAHATPIDVQLTMASSVVSENVEKYRDLENPVRSLEVIESGTIR